MQKVLKIFSLVKRGFTLIELMLVVAIISIVVILVLVSLMGARTKSKVATFKSQLQSMQTLAVSTCDSTTLSVANVVGPATGISYIGTVSDFSQNCAVHGGVFRFTVNSTGISPACVATVRDTGVTVSCP